MNDDHSTFASEIHDLALSRAATKLLYKTANVFKRYLHFIHSKLSHDKNKICMNAVVVGDGWVSSGGMCVEQKKPVYR